ncbi:MAG: hypothetical protein JSW11_05905, partial [Candidatus Heimdallarchaeota archaeon]
MNILRKSQPVIGSLTILLVIILGCIPIPLVPSLLPKETLEEGGTGIDPLKESMVEVPRLMEIINSYSNLGSAPNLTEIPLDNCTVPTFTIGAQEGQGGGNVNINDSFNLVDTLADSTQNSIDGVGYPTEKNTTITISTPPVYSRQDLVFNISGITAEYDWRLREALKPDFTTDFTILSTNGFKAYAMAFEIEEDYAALDTIRIYHSYSSSPTGEIYIVNETTSGQTEPNNTARISSIQSLIHQSGWYDYNFSSDS